MFECYQNTERGFKKEKEDYCLDLEELTERQTIGQNNERREITS
jgi:hypothetical protein